MAQTYEIRQQVETIDKKWLVSIFETSIQRVAKKNLKELLPIIRGSILN